MIWWLHVISTRVDSLKKTDGRLLKGIFALAEELLINSERLPFSYKLLISSIFSGNI